MAKLPLNFGKRPAVTTQFWAAAEDPDLAYVVFSRYPSRPVEMGRLQIIELGMTIASTGLTSTTMYADLPWR